MCIERSDSADRLGERVQRRAERGMTMQTDRHGQRVQKGIYRGVTVQTDWERKYRGEQREE